ncbi:MAG: hypothetical protein ACI8PT_002453 [Gammaproteobacteria bacterium]|jgi:hypothetical protein
MTDIHKNRRHFIKVSLAGAAALQLATVARGAGAAGLPHLDEADPSAKALAYVHDASAVSAQTRGDASRACSSCRFYTSPAEAWGPCALFPGKAVAAAGWCKAWVARA